MDAAGQPLQLPVVEYPNMQASHPDTKLGIQGVGTAITGARMYRGKEIEQLRGKLLVSDWSASFKEPSGQLFVAEPNAQSGQLWDLKRLLQIDARIVSLAEDADGEIYVLTNETFGPYGTTGRVWRLVEKR
jgi:glucose/arabinose dehydrogenase